MAAYCKWLNVVNELAEEKGGRKGLSETRVSHAGDI